MRIPVNQNTASPASPQPAPPAAQSLRQEEEQGQGERLRKVEAEIARLQAEALKLRGSGAGQYSAAATTDSANGVAPQASAMLARRTARLHDPDQGQRPRGVGAASAPAGDGNSTASASYPVKGARAVKPGRPAWAAELSQVTRAVDLVPKANTLTHPQGRANRSRAVVRRTSLLSVLVIGLGGLAGAIVALLMFALVLGLRPDSAVPLPSARRNTPQPALTSPALLLTPVSSTPTQPVASPTAATGVSAPVFEPVGSVAGTATASPVLSQAIITNTVLVGRQAPVYSGPLTATDALPWTPNR